MRWLIDGYNVLLGNDRGWDEAVRAHFGNRVAGHFAGKGVEVTIVYDSRCSPIIQRRALSPVCDEVYVADADAYLVETVERSGHPRGIILVTDDREIRDVVRARRPRRMSTAEFLELLKHQPAPEGAAEKPERETPGNIERYLKIFGAEPGD